MAAGCVEAASEVMGGRLPPTCSHTAPVIVELAPAGVPSRISQRSQINRRCGHTVLLPVAFSTPSQFCAARGGLQMSAQTKLHEKENAG